MKALGKALRKQKEELKWCTISSKVYFFPKIVLIGLCIRVLIQLCVLCFVLPQRKMMVILIEPCNILA